MPSSRHHTVEGASELSGKLPQCLLVSNHVCEPSLRWAGGRRRVAGIWHLKSRRHCCPVRTFPIQGLCSSGFNAGWGQEQLTFLLCVHNNQRGPVEPDPAVISWGQELYLPSVHPSHVAQCKCPRNCFEVNECVSFIECPFLLFTVVLSAPLFPYWVPQHPHTRQEMDPQNLKYWLTAERTHSKPSNLHDR